MIRTGMVRCVFLVFVMILLMLSAVSSIYAIENESDDLDKAYEETVEETEESTQEYVTLNMRMIGSGILRASDDQGNYVVLNGAEDEYELSYQYPVNTEVKIEAEVQDESCFIYGFYTKAEDDTMKQENIDGKGFYHESTFLISRNIEIFVVFAEIDNKEIVFENPLNEMAVYNVQPLAMGDVGQNWGMYNLFTEYTVIPEFGSRSAYLYGHVIQVDTNHDYVYEDTTHTAYCIEYNAPCPAGGYLTQSDAAIKQKKNIGHVLAYGWRQTGTDYNEDIYYDTYARCEITVTQGIIWCLLEDIFNTSDGEHAMTTMINATHHPEYARTYYNNLKQIILNIEKKPSFDGHTVTLEWNKEKKRYEATIKDTYGMLELFDYSYEGLRFEKDGNDLTIYTVNDYEKGVQVQGKRIIYGGSDSVVVWDGWNGNQDMITYKDSSCEIISNLTIKTKKMNGNISLIKKSSAPEITDGNTNYSLASAVYGVYSDKACKILVGTLITDASGISNDVSLSEGIYYVKETKASKGYQIDPDIYAVSISAGKESVLNVEEIPVLGKIKLTKTIHQDDINFDNGNPIFMFKLTGKFSNGSICTYYDIVDFTEEYVDGHTDKNGNVHMEVLFDKLPSGDYTAVELPSGRYSLEKITNVENGTVKDGKVMFSITTETSMEGSAQYINDNYEQQNYSDAVKVINELKKQ